MSKIYILSIVITFIVFLFIVFRYYGYHYRTMDEISPGLYLGNLKDATNKELL